MNTDCYKCKHVRSIPGDCHVMCTKPDKNMTANMHGILSGWFYYPLNYDPCWMTKECSNYLFDINK